MPRSFVEGRGGSEERQEKLNDIARQVENGSLVIRKMTPRERSAFDGRAERADLARRVRRVEDLGRPADLSDLDTGSPFDRIMREQANGNGNGHAKTAAAPAETSVSKETEVEEQPWTPAQVEEQRALIRRGDTDAWQLGDKLCDILLVGHTKATTGAFEHLRRLAGEVGAEFATLKRARQVSSAWPAEHRVAHLSVSAHAAYCTGGVEAAAKRRAFLKRLASEHGGRV